MAKCGQKMGLVFLTLCINDQVSKEVAIVGIVNHYKVNHAGGHGI